MSTPRAAILLVCAGLMATDPAPGRLTIELSTLHVAGLTAARGTTDSSDAPYLLISILQPQAGTGFRFPVAGHWRLAEDAVVAPTALQVLDLSPGDSARVVIAVLESEAADATPEQAGLAASTTALGHLAQPLLDPAGQALRTALADLGRSGVRRIGSVSLLVTNEGGTIWWRRMDCVDDCVVLQGPPAGTPGVPLGTPASGVYELTGAGGTYHLKLTLLSGA